MMDIDTFSPFSEYNYIEQNALIAKTYGVVINADDKILSITENGTLLAQVALDMEENKLSLIGRDGVIFSTVDLPLVDVIESAVYDDERKSLIIYVKLSDGTSKEIVVPFNDLLDDYAKLEQLEAETSARETFDTQITTDLDAEVARATAAEIKLENEKVSYTKAIKGDKEYNVIALDNYANLVGADTSGVTHNLAMVSKWDVADFGAVGLPINLNGNNPRPTYNDTKDIALLSDVSAETTAREEADATLTSGLAAEVARATAAEGANATAIATETTAREEADATLTSGLDAEVARATAAEGANATAIATETTARETFDTQITTDLDAEVARATAAEGANATAIAAEKTAREEADTTLTTDLAAEVARATAAEIKLENEKVSYTKAIKDDKEYNVIALDNYANLVGADTSGVTHNLAMVSKWDVADFGAAGLPINLNGNKPRPTYNDTKDIALSSDVSAETTAREEADATLTSGLAAEVARATAAEGANAAAISAETTAREEADATLTSGLAAEVTRSETVDTKLRTDLDYESSRALEAEANINKELDRKVNWDESKTKIVLPLDGMIVGTMSGVTGETAGVNLAMVNKWNVADYGSVKLKFNLNGVDTHPTYNDTETIALLSDVVVETTAREEADTILDESLTEEITRAKDAEKVNADAISAETTRATAAEGANATAIATEKTAREEADTTLTNGLAAEVTRATAAEGANATAIAELLNRIIALESKKYVLSDDMDNVSEMTQAQYDALTVKDPKTLYLIVG